METRVLYKQDPSFLACPDCGQVRLTKSRSRNIRERITKQFTFYRTYRCKNCGWRGQVSSYTFRMKSLKAIFFYIIVIGISIFVVSMIMKRFV